MYADVLSPSAVEQFEKCPKQYWFKVKGFKGKPRGANTGGNVGLCFHGAIETFIDMKYKRTFRQALAWFVTNVKYFDQGVQKETLKIWDAWSKKHQMPDIVEVQMGESKLSFPMTEIPFGPIGDKVRGIIIQPKNQVEFDSGLRIHGFIDMIYAETNAKNQVTNLVVVDWKTQRYKIPFIHLKRQAQIYALAVQKLTGFPVRVEFAFIRFPVDSLVKWTPTNEELEQLELELSSLQTYMLTLPDEKVEAKIGEYCKYCPFNYDCKAYNKWIKRDTETGAKVWQMMELNELIQEFDMIRAKKNVITSEFYELRDLVISGMQQKNLVAFGDFKIDYRLEKERTEEAQRIIKLFEGVEHVPAQLMSEVEEFHTNWKSGNPYLRKVKNASY